MKKLILFLVLFLCTSFPAFDQGKISIPVWDSSDLYKVLFLQCENGCISDNFGNIVPLVQASEGKDCEIGGLK